jgi:DNA-binding NarL/FixJ family response regulator
MDNGPTATRARHPRLVIADDDPVVQLVLSMSLEREFDVVGVAADGEEAVDLALAMQPDAALIDVEMPKGGGLRAVQGIRQVAPGAAIVILSRYQSHGVVHELTEAGAIAYRRKGVAPDVLAEALTESIKVHLAERRESAEPILVPYCLGLGRWPRRQARPQ